MSHEKVTQNTSVPSTPAHYRSGNNSNSGTPNPALGKPTEINFDYLAHALSDLEKEHVDSKCSFKR